MQLIDGSDDAFVGLGAPRWAENSSPASSAPSQSSATNHLVNGFGVRTFGTDLSTVGAEFDD